MEKRYQIFISSTFRDLIDERQSVLKAVLELDHMPAGMELFPAADESAWQLIEDVIDSSDYYVVVIGGKYGSLDEEGIGYTEKEYDYAVSQSKPVIPLLHKDPGKLPREKTDTESSAWDKLNLFRKKIERKHTCNYWETADELKAQVIISVTSCIKKHPAVGWIRADQMPANSTIKDILVQKERIAELEKDLQRFKEGPPPGTDELSQGEDTVLIKFYFTAYDGSSYAGQQYNGQINLSWNEIFSSVAPSLINDSNDISLRKAFRKCFKRNAIEFLSRQRKLKGNEFAEFEFEDHDIDTCIVQFRALGLIVESDRKRSIKDTFTYWALTPYGDKLMVQLRALQRDPVQVKKTIGKTSQAPDN